MKLNQNSCVVYLRVSTARQGESALGLEAQRTAVIRYAETVKWPILAEYLETESGKKITNRPELAAALDICRKKHATLVIAKLDRLARNVHFISGLLESGVDFVAVDQPTKDRFMLHVQAAFAEEEARRISQRTKEALAAAKRRGIVLGATGRARATVYKQEAIQRALGLSTVVQEIQQSGKGSVRQMCEELNSRGIASPAGARWHLPGVHRLLKRLKLHSA